MSRAKTVLIWCGLIALTSPLFGQSEMEKRWSAQATDRNQAFDLNAKTFQGSNSAGSKSFATSKSGMQKEFQTKTFASAPFSDQKSAALAQKKFATEKSKQQAKQFSTQSAASLKDQKFQSKEFSDQQKKPVGSDRVAPSQAFKPESKTPGYWKSFQEKLKKDLTMEEIRELLNKPPTN